MISFSQEEFLAWARLGPRAVYGQTLLKLASEEPKIIALSADLGNSSGLERFKSSFPNRFINIGIAEQNLVGVAAGLAKEGFIPFASSFAPFITMRACEQVRMNLGYMQLNVKIVAIGSGLSMGFLGNSHYGLEDIAIIRAIPNITIISPADCAEVVKSVNAACKFTGPVYIRLTGVPNSKLVYEEDYEFVIGKAVDLRIGKDLAIIATGSVTAEALEAAKFLEKKGISSSVINMHTIKPLDEEKLLDLSQNFEKMVIIEEHSRVGGLGSAIAEFYMSKFLSPKILHIALKDDFGPTGEYIYLLEKYFLDCRNLTIQIQDFLEKI